MKSISETNGIDLVSKEDRKILSIGISTSGNAEIEMIQKNPNVHITATTIDKEGLEITRKIVVENNLEEKITLKLEDITEPTNYKDNSFDYVYARLVLHYLDNEQLRKSLKEIYRILKENGKFFVVVRSVNAWEAKLDGTTYDEKTGLTKHPDIRTYNTPNVKYCYRRLHSEESIKEFLEEANFKVTSIKTYDEILSPDYNREKMNEKASELIEVIAQK